MTSNSPGSQRAGHAFGAVITGGRGHLAEARATVTARAAGLTITGLAGDSAAQARDRIRAALVNAGLWPGCVPGEQQEHSITVSLEPAGLARYASTLDLAIAVAVLEASGLVPATAAEGCLFAAELGLDGSLRPVRGIAPAVLAAAEAGFSRVVVAPDNAADAQLAAGISVISCQSLQKVQAWLSGQGDPGQPARRPAASAETGPGLPPFNPMAHIAVPAQTRTLLEASAAGRHHLCLAGPSRAGIPGLAQAVAGLLPPLSSEEATEVAAIQAAVGRLDARHWLSVWPPFRQPHHTLTAAAVLGGGSRGIRPGEAALAHRGVLFLGQAPEFSRDVLAGLRQPLERGEVAIARGGSVASFPAQFVLVAGLPPCPCQGRPGCRCTRLQAQRYRARFIAVLGTYISLWAQVTPPALGTAGVSPAETSAAAEASAALVAAARARASHRLRGTPWQVNAEIPAAQLRGAYAPSPWALAPVERAADLGQISDRGACQAIRVAWTLADLAGKPRPGPRECAGALACYLGTSR